MRSVNKVILIGNLTRDPEMRQTPNNQNVTTFGLATNRAWVTQGGDKKDSAEFHECVAWARLAEICSEYLKRGNLVYVEGYLKTRNWESPEGIKKFKTEIVVQDMIILEKRKYSDESGAESGTDQDRTMGEESEKTNDIEFVSGADDMGTPAEEEMHGESPIDKDLGL